MYFYFDLLFNLQHFSIKKIKVNNKIKFTPQKVKAFFVFVIKYIVNSKIKCNKKGIEKDTDS